MTRVTREEFRRAQCRGLLTPSEMAWGVNAEAWVRDGKVIAAKRVSHLGITSYYIEGNA